MKSRDNGVDVDAFAGFVYAQRHRNAETFRLSRHTGD